MTLLIPHRLPSAANERLHWRVKAKRTRAQRELVAIYIGGKRPPALPVVVTLIRIAPRALDGDNLQSAFKAMRDEVANWLGVPDNHPSIRWEYGQRRGGVGEYAVTISIARCDT
jgi:hypothetical protein